MTKDLTKGNIAGVLLRFSGPYLVASFLQTFYGLADLFITGQYNGADVISGVSIGSQVMHMLTVVIVGLAMGSTVNISRAVGAKDKKSISRSIGNSIILFTIFAAAATAVLLLSTGGIIRVLSTPPEAIEETRRYLVICFIGIPFITAYNVISSIFRGLGDTKSPMIFVAIAGVINIVLDIILIGPFSMGAGGAALATAISQAISVVLALFALMRFDMGIHLHREDFRRDRVMMRRILMIGGPISLQDGLIQVSFLIITSIANSRGVDVAAAVGIVEKIISFLFLVPSAMLSAVSTVTAQNAGAGLHERGRQSLFLGMGICVLFGLAVFTLCQFLSPQIVSLFVHDDPKVVELGGQYLRTYSLDCVFAGIHFCFSGYFSAYGKSGYSFFHNILSVCLVRIPGAYLASVYFPQTLTPMGLAAPMGSLLSSVICLILYRTHRKVWKEEK